MTTTPEVRVFTGRSRMTKLMVFLVCASVYGGALFATGFLPVIPGVTWLRPANMLSELFGLNLGPLGALATAVGNTLGDQLRGQNNPAFLWWVLPLEFLFTSYIVYWGVSDPSLRTWRGKLEWLVYAVVLQGILTGFGISFFICYVHGLQPAAMFRTIGWTITLNESIPAVAAGLVQYYLFPQIVRLGFWWGRDLTKSRVPPALLSELGVK